MSAGPNPMPHPDENLLSALAEQTLSGAERESVLLHLSSCARCREIVFLAQEALPQPEPAAVVAKRPARRQRLRWQTATAGAWVVALVVATALLWHSHRTFPPSDQQALVRPAVPPVTNRAEENQPANAVPAPPPPPPVAKAPRDEVAADKKSLNALANFENGRIENAPGVRLKPTAPAAVQSFIAPPARAPERQNAIATDQLQSMQVQGKELSPPKTNSAQFEVAPAAPMSGSSPAMFDASNTLAASKSMAGVAQNKPAATAETHTAQMQAPIRLPRFAVMKGKLLRLDAGSYASIGLPPGTAAHAVASSANVVLLLTRRSALYRSTDYGEHWTKIPAQWSGKAANLNLKSANAISQSLRVERDVAAGAIGNDAASGAHPSDVLKSSTASMVPDAPPSAAETKAPASSAVVFELTNSAGKRWLSRDGGQSWQPE